MSYKDLVIINNEKISEKEKVFFCDNVDIKSISENLGKNFNLSLIARSTKINRKHEIKLENIKNLSNIFSFFYNIFKTFKKHDAIYLIISITPYTFFSYIFLFLFRRKIFVYLMV